MANLEGIPKWGRTRSFALKINFAVRIGDSRRAKKSFNAITNLMLNLWRVRKPLDLEGQIMSLESRLTKLETVQQLAKADTAMQSWLFELTTAWSRAWDALLTWFAPLLEKVRG